MKGEIMNRLVGIVVATAAVASIITFGATATKAPAAVSFCTPKSGTGATRMCGPATVKLSLYPGLVFRNGSCLITTRGGLNLTIELGALSYVKPASNGGLTYLQLMVSGPLSSPTGGHLIVWVKGKRWSGLGTTFNGNARRGTFAVRALPPSRGVATGSYSC